LSADDASGGDGGDRRDSEYVSHVISSSMEGRLKSRPYVAGEP
jgi:hypothetical protein